MAPKVIAPVGRRICALDRFYFMHRQMAAEAVNGEGAIQPGNQALDWPGGLICRPVQHWEVLRSISVGLQFAIRLQ